ncbi:MAG TPA: Asp-tRNA(Asn)/Glu-tRNA(Gln) amidotransferase subunit GatA [Candidatus Paceibacterota bacterium]|nr:Asp-tRNA(Asn)/Glu-tRNA(Gln) amidotransferase subunit GatA [Candidatus Paceibacterota bacterium]
MNKDLTIKKFREGFLNKEFSSLEVVKDTFKRIEEKDDDLKAYISLDKDLAYEQAEKADLALAENKNISLIEGLPIALKDNILLKGMKTTAASQILKDYKASYDATVVSKIKEAGGVFLGKTNLDEFAMGSSTENSSFQVTKNPHDLSRVPGGSSGGSAAAVASGEALAALGSDTGGSIRQPAAFCGVVGMKPTYGTVSRHGLIAMASSLDQIGPITKTVEDAKILFEVIKGKDRYDSTSTDVSLKDKSLDDVKKLKIGVPKEYFVDGLDESVRKGVEKARSDLESLGIEFEEVSLPHTKYALSVYYIIMPAEVSTNLARFDGIRYGEREEASSLEELYLNNKSSGFGEETKRRLILGTFVLSSGYYDAYYKKAQKVRRLIKNDFDKVFEEVDLVLTPTTPTPPFKIGEKTDDPLSMYLSDLFTIPANLAGLPAISIPVADYSTEEGLPVGFQLIGKRFGESDIFGVGSFYEKINN